MSSVFSVYGIKVISDFDLSLLGLKSLKDNFDAGAGAVRIVHRRGPVSQEKYKDYETHVGANSGFYFRKHVALFKFHSANQIDVYPLCTQITADFIRILLNFPMTSVLFQGGYFSLHASAILLGEKVFLFCGKSLSGKSTLVAKLIAMGGQLITEDSAIIRLTEEGAMIGPSYPVVKLSNESSKFLLFNQQSGIVFPADKNMRQGYFVPEKKIVMNSVKIDYCLCLDWTDNETEIVREDFFSLHLRLLDISLNAYPLSRSREHDLFKFNMHFLKLVDAFVYKRKRSLRALDNILNDLISLRSFYNEV